MSEPRPYQPPTEEEIALIDKALEKTKGNRAHAAIILKMDAKRVYNLVMNVPSLQAKWGTKAAIPVVPSPATDLHRPEDGPFTPKEKDIVMAITKEDATLQKGWKRLGFDDKERKFLAGLQATYAGNVKSTLDLAFGGAAHANTRLLLLLEDLTKKIQDIQENPDNYRREYMTEHGARETKGPDEYLAEFMSLAVSVSTELRRMGEGVLKANELRLKIEKFRLLQASAKNRVEAGWEVPVAKKAEGDK